MSADPLESASNAGVRYGTNALTRIGTRAEGRVGDVVEVEAGAGGTGLPSTTACALSEATSLVRMWLRDRIVGLNLCPYARGPLEGGRVRLAVGRGDLEERLTAVAVEAERLLKTSATELETTLVILPSASDDFEQFVDDTELAMDLVHELVGDVLQVVPFHPLFRFDGADADDPGNGTNRSPVPLWHLLRDASVSRVVDADPEGVRAIPERNRRVLSDLDQ